MAYAAGSSVECNKSCQGDWMKRPTEEATQPSGRHKWEKGCPWHRLTPLFYLRSILVDREQRILDVGQSEHRPNNTSSHLSKLTSLTPRRILTGRDSQTARPSRCPRGLGPYLIIVTNIERGGAPQASKAATRAYPQSQEIPVCRCGISSPAETMPSRTHGTACRMDSLFQTRKRLLIDLVTLTIVS